jgi:hypothetical protein
MEKELEKIYLERMDGVANLIGSDPELLRPDDCDDEEFVQLCREVGIGGIYYTESNDQDGLFTKKHLKYDCFLSVRLDASGKTGGIFFNYQTAKNELDIRDLIYCLMSDYRLRLSCSSKEDFLSEYGYLDGTVDSYVKGVSVYNQLENFDDPVMEHLFTEKDLEKLTNYFSEY